MLFKLTEQIAEQTARRTNICQQIAKPNIKTSYILLAFDKPFVPI
jgi:hypothetical protein